MKFRCAALYANSILKNEASRHILSFLSWQDFEGGFTSKFCPKNEATAALTKLESTHYYQRRKAVDDYIDEFSELVEEAGYMDGLSIVMKFWRGRDRDIQDQIAELVQGRPEDNDPDRWYGAAHMFDANRTANQAFHGMQHTMVLSPNVRPMFPTPRATFPVQPMTSTPTLCTSQYPGVPMCASNVPTPLDIDATHCRNAIPMLCRHCGEPGHFTRECPKAYDIHYMSSDEREDWIEHLLSGSDVAAAEAQSLILETLEVPLEQLGGTEEDFTSHSG
jgi:hypothetical protein